MSTHVKFFLWSLGLIPLLFLIPGRAATEPQEGISRATSVTGCLQAGEEPGGFFIIENGRMWELFDNIDAGHVGKTVRVTGRFLQLSDEEEAKLEEFEKKEAKRMSYADFKVSNLEVIRNSCKLHFCFRASRRTTQAILQGKSAKVCPLAEAVIALLFRYSFVATTKNHAC